MSSAVDELCAILREVGARVTFDPERSTALPCMICGTTDRPRDLVAIGTWTRPIGGHVPGDQITRPMCSRCEPRTLPHRPVVVQSGPGSFTIDDWIELWSAVWRVVAYAIRFDARGRCSCGCLVATCDYCAHECIAAPLLLDLSV